jgi:ribosomal protein S19E (S16A)
VAHRRRVPKDRVISTVDTEARHGHKTTTAGSTASRVTRRDVLEQLEEAGIDAMTKVQPPVRRVMTTWGRVVAYVGRLESTARSW